MSTGDPSSGEAGSVTESLRTAVERTLAATAGTAAETRGRAQELLDEVARRGQRTREGLAGMRVASVQELQSVEGRLGELEARIEALEIAMRAAPRGGSKAQPED
jgi:polyhydroxyalkanoate synthesis regulator phasin